jgi:hypothetical protein
MSPDGRRILDRFAARVRDVAPSVANWAFGAPEARPDSESDFDLWLVLPVVTRELRERIYEIAWEIGFDEGCVLSPLLLSEDDFERKPLSASTLVARIRREGIAARPTPTRFRRSFAIGSSRPPRRWRRATSLS